MGMAPCIDMPDGWNKASLVVTLAAAISTWLLTRYFTHGIWVMVEAALTGEGRRCDRHPATTQARLLERQYD